MQMSFTGPLTTLVLLALVATSLFVLLRRRKQQSVAASKTLLQPPIGSPKKEIPTRIVIGENPDQPLVTIEALDSPLAYEKAQQLDVRSGPISRLSPLLQAAPSLLVAGETAGKRMMEVVIKGDLVRAADGNGLRAFTMGADGFKQNARLFEVSNLQEVINAAAIWQIASVVVAQKHLADISEKLDEIKDGVQRISQFLDNQRKARIQSTYEYLAQAYHAIQAGELPSSVRNQLESCERDLLEIQNHLEMEFRQKVDKKIEKKEKFGTGDLTADVTAKIVGLNELAGDLALCIKTRIAGWHVLSQFPGEPHLKTARRANIQESIESFQSLGPYCKAVKQEIAAVDSFWNRSSTLEGRRTTLLSKCDSTMQALLEKGQHSLAAIERCDQLMLADGCPTRILLQFENDSLVGALQA